MKSIPCMKALCVVLLSCCITFIGCSDSPETNNPSIGTLPGSSDSPQLDNQSGGNLPVNWQVRDTEPPSFTATAVPGKWYLFNLYTINSITPANIHSLSLRFRSSYSLQIPKVASPYNEASNFRAWVFIPDTTFSQNRGVSFSVQRSDGVRNRSFESMNLSISSSIDTDENDNEYRYGALPYAEDPSASEFRKVIRTWENVPLQVKTINVELTFSPQLDEGDLLVHAQYLCTPDSNQSFSYGEVDSLSGSYTKSGSQYRISVPHLHYLSSTSEQAIGNGALLTAFVTKPMYNQLDLHQYEDTMGTWNESTISLPDITMFGLSFLTIRYVLSNDSVFDEAEEEISLNSLAAVDIPESYHQYLPFDGGRMSDLQSFDPDGDGISELRYRSRNSIQYNAVETFVSTFSSPDYAEITNYSTAAGDMRKVSRNSYTFYSTGTVAGLRLIQKTSSGKYLKMELVTQREITLAEYNSLKNRISLGNPID